MTFDNRAGDWRQLTAEKLSALDLDAAEREEIVSELAAHLEDLYQQYRERGLPESRAIASALDDVSDWRELGRKIRRARRKENEMNQRTKAVWIPGLISLTVASGVLALLQVWGVRPHIVWTRSGLALLFYIPWLAAQPVFGAAGAYLSRRLGGTRTERLVAAIFPSIAMFLAFCGLLAILAVLNVFGIGDHISAMNVIRFLELYGSLWVVVPGFALALGALPFLAEPRAEQAH
jgi:hypothetical protein